MKNGHLIAWARKNHGLSQEALAELANLSTRTIQRIEKDLVNPYYSLPKALVAWNKMQIQTQTQTQTQNQNQAFLNFLRIDDR